MTNIGVPCQMNAEFLHMCPVLGGMASSYIGVNGWENVVTNIGVPCQMNAEFLHMCPVLGGMASSYIGAPCYLNAKLLINSSY